VLGENRVERDKKAEKEKTKRERVRKTKNKA
jgi:hypothetical protein